MIKRLMVMLGLVLALLAAGEALLPAAVSEIVAQGMISQTGSDSVNAQVAKRPAWLMLGGQFDQISVEAANARADKLVFSRFHAVLSDVALDMNTLLTRRLIMLKSVGAVELTAVVTEDELARYLNQTVKGVKNATVAITPGKVQATSSFAIGSFANVGITLEGRIVADSQKIKFVTEKFLLNNSLVGNIGGGMLTEIPLLDLKKLPFGVTVRDIAMEQGQIVIHAGNGGSR